jgi:hypothetical protein
MLIVIGCTAGLLMGAPSCAQEQERSAAILSHYALPSFSLENLGYTPEELAIAQGNGLPFVDLPAPGSGLQKLGGNYFVGVSDRGPAVARTTPTPGRVFPLPSYTPTIFFLRAHGSEIELDAFIPIVADDSGTPVTGISNSGTDDAFPFASPGAAVPLPYNQNGLDIEDLHMFADGQFIMVDEYSPSVVIIGDDGKVLKRYTPAGKTLSSATYPVSDTLPAILAQRRANRGFEAVAVSDDEQTAYIIMQSPLGPTAAGTPTRNSRVLRILRLDISDRLAVQVTGQFLMLMRPAAEYPLGNRPQDLKLSAAVCVSGQQLLVLERSDEPGIGAAKLVLIDLAGATDVSHLPAAQTLALEDSSLDLSTLGITTAASTVVFDNSETPDLTDFKLEGLSILNRNKVVVSNDNDFGLAGRIPFQIWEIRLKDQLPQD